MMHHIRLVYLLYILVLVWIQPADVLAGGQTSSLFVEHESANDRFLEIFEEVFSEVNEFPIERVRELLDEMWHIAPEVRFADEIRRRGKDLALKCAEASIDLSCSVWALDEFGELQEALKNHKNLGPYLAHYNKIRFEYCIGEESRKLSERLNMIGSIEKVPDIIENLQRRLQQSSGPVGNDLRDFIPGKAFAGAVMDHLASLGHNLDKPRDRSMFDQVNKVERIVSDEYDSICVRLRSDFLDFELVYHTIESINSDYNELIPNEARKIRAYLKTCERLSLFNSEYLYPLAKYQFHELHEKIMTNTAEVTIEPEEMMNLIDQSLFAGQAEFVALDRDHSASLKPLVDLMVVSQINENKCGPGYIQAVSSLRSRHGRNQNLVSYLDHYSQLQLTRCSSVIAEEIREKLGIDDIEWNDVDELRKHIDSAKLNQSDLEATLFKPIPDDLILAGLKGYLKSKGPVNTEASDERQSTTLKDTLIHLCRAILNDLNTTWIFFNEFHKLCTITEDNFHPDSLRWISNHNLCRSMFAISTPNSPVQGIPTEH